MYLRVVLEIVSPDQYIHTCHLLFSPWIISLYFIGSVALFYTILQILGESHLDFFLEAFLSDFKLTRQSKIFITESL